MRTLNTLESEVRLDTKRVGSARFPICLRACCPDDTFNAPVDVWPPYIGIELRVLTLLRFHKTLCLLQFPFPYAPKTFLSQESSEIPRQL